MRVELVTPAKLAFSIEKATHVILPGTDGSMGVLPGHVPMITTLQGTEVVSIDTEGHENELTFKIGKGFAEITNDSVTIFAETVEQMK